MAQNKQLNILAWYDDIQKQNHRKWWAFDRVFSLITGLDTLPPFQMVRAQTGAAITELKLIDFQSGVETDILNSALATGLEVATFTDYDLVIYPSVLPLQIVDVQTGHYYLKMSDASNTWFSEVFNMSDDLSDFIKIEYWHGEDFVFPNGHIRYRFPFKNRVYIPSDIGKPSYEYEEQVVKRDGYNFPTQQISYKLHRFVMLAPEFLIDAMRVIRMHDFVEIFYQGYEHEVDELLMNDPRWQTQGDLAEVEVEFKTDTVVVTNGRGLTSTEYLVADDECITSDRVAVARLTEGSAEYTGFYYNQGGNQVDLETGDIILKVETSGDIVAEQYNGSGYSALSTSDGGTAYDQRGDKYYVFYDGTYGDPLIDGFNNTGNGVLLTGRSFPNTIVDIYVENTSGDQIKTGSGSSADFATIGIAYTSVIGYNRVRVKATSINCSGFEQSNFIEFFGVGSGVIGSSFAIG